MKKGSKNNMSKEANKDWRSVTDYNVIEEEKGELERGIERREG